MRSGSFGRRHTRPKFAIALIALLLAAAAFVFIPRQADLRAFDAAAVARAETAMWRHYYEKRYIPLFLDLYGLARDEQNFSPWDSFSLSVAAARAARNFQPSRSRVEADAALPQLIEYFRILAGAAAVAVDVPQIARAELDWWQARREAVAPEDYGLIIARVSSLLYGVDDDDVRKAGVLRARAMAYRDARDNAMTDADWASIAEQLTASYSLLKRAVSARAR